MLSPAVQATGVSNVSDTRLGSAATPRIPSRNPRDEGDGRYRGMEDPADPLILHDLLRETADHARYPRVDFSTDAATSYLNQLISLPLSQLSREPTSISAEASGVESELTNLCYREYPTFISVHKCSAAIQSAFEDFEGSLDRLLGSVPDLEQECREFQHRTKSISGVRNRAILVQEHQDKLTDLLELPQLMESCVRNGYYQEAMELSAHAREMEEKYQGIKLVQDVAREVESVVQLLLSQLLGLLREPVKLPTLVKAVNFLRRSGHIDEPTLANVFLNSRLTNFRSQLIHIERDRTEPVRYLRKYIDLFREHVYDIISQYTTIFEEDEIVVSFAGQCVTDLVRLVSAYVPRLANDPASLSSILVQLGYCSISFARVGLDFASLITLPFANTVLSTYSYAVAAAADKLGSTLKTAIQAASSPTDILVDADRRANVVASPPDFHVSDDIPPVALSYLPPIAIYFNENLAAINSLRLLAPYTLRSRLVAAQSHSLISSSSAVLDFLNKLDVTSDSSEVNGNAERPTHRRTPSSPRSHLLRRNTETQFAPSVRAVRRREARTICLVFARGWVATISFLWNALQSVLAPTRSERPSELKAKLADLHRWIETLEGKTATDQPIAEINGSEAKAAGSSATVVLAMKDAPLANGDAPQRSASPQELQEGDRPTLSIETSLPEAGILPIADTAATALPPVTPPREPVVLPAEAEEDSTAVLDDLEVEQSGRSAAIDDVFTSRPPVVAPIATNNNATASPHKEAVVEAMFSAPSDAAVHAASNLIDASAQDSPDAEETASAAIEPVSEVPDEEDLAAPSTKAVDESASDIISAAPDEEQEVLTSPAHASEADVEATASHIPTEVSEVTGSRADATTGDESLNATAVAISEAPIAPASDAAFEPTPAPDAKSASEEAVAQSDSADASMVENIPVDAAVPSLTADPIAPLIEAQAEIQVADSGVESEKTSSAEDEATNGEAVPRDEPSAAAAITTQASAAVTETAPTEAQSETIPEATKSAPSPTWAEEPAPAREGAIEAEPAVPQTGASTPQIADSPQIPDNSGTTTPNPEDDNNALVETADGADAPKTSGGAKKKKKNNKKKKK